MICIWVWLQLLLVLPISALAPAPASHNSSSNLLPPSPTPTLTPLAPSPAAAAAVPSSAASPAAATPASAAAPPSNSSQLAPRTSPAPKAAGKLSPVVSPTPSKVAPVASPTPSKIAPVVSPTPGKITPAVSPTPEAAPGPRVANGTLDPAQVAALKLLGISVGADPCNTASQHITICDEGTPYRHLVSLELDYCSDGAVFPASAWTNLTSLHSITFNECPAKVMQLPQKLVNSLTSLSCIASLGRAVGNELAPGLPGKWLSQFHNLEQLTVSDVLVNATSIGSVIANLTRLQVMSIQGANFTGPLPKVWASNITSIEISGNEVTGNIPNGITQLKQLQSLDLTGNNLTGTIPTGLGNLSSLLSLKLASNSFKGSIPSSFKKLTSLTVLDLSNNQLNGSIPVFLSSLPSLRVMDIQNNDFRGEIPFNDTFLKTLNSFKATGNGLLCYNSSITSAKFAGGVQPCDSSGLPVEGPASGPAFSPGGAPAPQPHVQTTKHHHGPKKIVVGVAIALAAIVGVIIIAVLLSRCCSRKY